MSERTRRIAAASSCLTVCLMVSCGGDAPAGGAGSVPPSTGGEPATAAATPADTASADAGAPGTPAPAADAGTPATPVAAADAGAPVLPTPPAQPTGGPRYTVSFVIRAMGRAAGSDAPRSRVGVLITGPRRMRRAFGIGTLVGVVGPMSAEDTEGALGGISSWWAGAGEQITVSRVVESIIVQRRDIGEGQDDQPAPPQPWRQVGRVDHVPVEAEVVVEPPAQ